MIDSFLGRIVLLALSLLWALPSCSRAASLATATPSPSPTDAATATRSPTPTSPAGARMAVIGGHTFMLEVADDTASRAKGLSGRTGMDRDHGMLFVFPGEEQPAFWMLDTLIPLDLLFVDRDLRVVSVQTMLPEPGVTPSLLKRYLAPSPVLYAVELNAGVAAEYGIGVGATMEFK